VQTLEMAYDGKNNSFVFASDFVTLSTTIANIQSTYRDFYATLDIRPNINNIRDIGYNHYLEYIYSNNYASNSMLSNYRDIGVFSNMAISRYYEDYLNNNKNVQSYNFFDANQMLNPSSTFGSGSATDFMTNLHDALLVKYYAPYSLTADKLDQYNIFHSSGGANAINLYKEIGLSS
jgi:hypothetical protein